MSIVHLKIRLKKQSVFGIFIGIKQAFDKVNHFKLWRKMYDNRISAKIIRLVQIIYKNTHVYI